MPISSSSDPLDGGGVAAAVGGERVGGLGRRGALGRVLAAVGELVGGRVEALELQQVVGQHAAEAKGARAQRRRVSTG